MPTLLVIQAHPKTDQPSNSLAVEQTFIDAYTQSHPHDDVIIRDVYADHVPEMNDETFGAWQKMKMNQELTPAEQTLLNRHTDWLTEFTAADKYLFVNPMYNHFLPAELKQYIDVVSVARKTFRYTANGPVGMMIGKKAAHIQSAGGYYHTPENPAGDFGSQYLTSTLAIFGIMDVVDIDIEGADAHPEQAGEILAAAKAEAKTVAATF
ncbi:FMN-dependent NADH-azoreductase [Levilactobacillus bambusae]|uniref:FMN dependent NADH:quinone oxidoreductase n=1 Tax=Levilactobacillus bambusae TaxID=2024736 RepID=A0A2V1MZ06_9LACO|nr:NAD(P)H-dependent oxidoreductase [Levilactobacillus bambusae]PWG00244.1 FMN-dependent NADH-azoreductase [Levilactobacillus bambusae]